jgi:hypothetical protein
VTLGVVTPVGILAVNASAFVMLHLDAFRLVIAGCAVLSGLVLNGLAAWWLLRLASIRAAAMYHEYRVWVIGAAVLVVGLTAAAGGYLTYLGLRDPRHLPDSLSMVVASVMLLLPFAVAFAGRRISGLGGIIPFTEPATRAMPNRTSPSGRSLREGPTSPQAGK